MSAGGAITEDALVGPATGASTDPPRLRRVLGPLEVTASGVGIIIGAGIYVLLGAATAEAGNAVWLSFVLAAGLCALTGLSYAELASMFPSAGAEYDYTRRVFPARWSFLVGWTMVIGLMVAAATIAVGFAHYLRYFVDVPIVPAAIALVVLDAVVARAGVGRSARLTLALSAIQVAGLVLVVAIGVTHVGSVSIVSDASASGVFGGAALVFFAFIGFDEVITLAEETRDPTRTIPRALFAALAISTVLYVGVAIAAVSVVGAQDLAGSSRPLADVMAHVLGGRAERVVAAIALVTTVNTSLLALTAASRLTYGMASAGALPAPAARVSPRTGAPSTAIGIAAAGAVAFALAGDLTFIASVTDFAVYIVFLAVNAAVVVLRRRAPDVPRPFRTPGTIRGVPVVPVAGAVATVLMVPQLSLRSLALGAALLVAGLLVQLVVDRSRPPAETAAGPRPPVGGAEPPARGGGAGAGSRDPQGIPRARGARTRLEPRRHPPPGQAVAMRVQAEDGVELWWDREGEGPAVLLVPGRGDPSDLFPAELSAVLVAAGFSVVRWDPRDTGLSGDGGDQYTVATLADDAVRVLDAAGVERAHVLGISMAGLVLGHLATRHRSRVRSLTFVSAMSPDPEAGFGEDLFAPLEGGEPDRLADLVRAMGSTTGADLAWAAALLDRGDERAAPRPDAVRRHQDAAFRLDWPALEDLRGIEVPTLVVHGRLDRVLPVAHAEALGAAIPGSTVIVIDDMGHIPRRHDWHAIAEQVVALY